MDTATFFFTASKHAMYANEIYLYCYDVSCNLYECFGFYCLWGYFFQRRKKNMFTSSIQMLVFRITHTCGETIIELKTFMLFIVSLNVVIIKP